jgi:predicted metal-dependent hydrolase
MIKPKILTQNVEIDGVKIFLSQKRIKNLHLRICPPFGDVKVSAPLRLNLEAIKSFILSKINWIKDRQIAIRNRKIAPELKFISDEEHYFFGKKYLLEIVENSNVSKVLLNEEKIKIYLKKKSTMQHRRKMLYDFYRVELKKIIPQFITKYEKIMKVEVKEFGVKRMKTRWGTCNVRVNRIWLNLELAKKPLQSLEFIIVHEMVHLLERKHSKRFYALMDKFMPEWKVCKDKLKIV